MRTARRMGTELGVVATGEEGGESGFLRRSQLTIAGGVRGDNWSKERIGYRWPGFFRWRVWPAVLRRRGIQAFPRCAGEDLTASA